MCKSMVFFFFSSRRRHTRSDRDWSSDVCSSDLTTPPHRPGVCHRERDPGRCGGVVRGESDLPRARDSAERLLCIGEEVEEHLLQVVRITPERSEERRVGKECRSGGEGERGKREG